jgi:hypothetical protein
MGLSYASSILGRKFGVYSAPISISPYDPDAQAWFNAIATAGGQVLTVNKQAVSTFFTSLKSLGLWNKIVLANLLGWVSDGTGGAGSGMAAAITTPIKNTQGASIANNNFTSYGDYLGDFYPTQQLLSGGVTVPAGLKGNGVTKYLTTTLAHNNSIFGAATTSSRHVYIYQTQKPTIPNGYLLNGGGLGVGSTSILALSISADTQVKMNTVSSPSLSLDNSKSVGLDYDGTTLHAWDGATPQNIDTTTSYQTANSSVFNIFVGRTASGSKFSFADSFMCFFSIGNHLAGITNYTGAFDAPISTLISSTIKTV